MIRLQSGGDPDEDQEPADDTFWQKFFVYPNRWPLPNHLGGEDAGCGGPGLV